jgi:hypothetical protein
MRFISSIKNKWGIKSNWQFVIINLVFAISGSLTVYIRKPVFLLFGIDQNTPLPAKICLYLLIVTPAFYTILFCVATLFGQFSFFWELEKRFFRKLQLKARRVFKRN